jgi:hypothetical protein
VAAEPLLVRVQHATQHQFAAGVEKFDVHPPQFRVSSGRWQVRPALHFFGLGLRTSTVKVPSR